MLSWLLQNPNTDSEGTNSSTPTTLPGYLRYKLFRDQLSGSLTSDGKCVFAVEESDSQFLPFRMNSRPRFGELFLVPPINKLVAYDLNGGRLLWEAGGLRGTPPIELSGIFFLGPPLPFAGRLYCLAEVKDEIHLLALVPENNSIRLEWSQALITLHDAADAIPFFLPRRQTGLRLSTIPN